MATANDIVTRALRKAAISAIDEAPSADDAANGLEALNMMLAAWKLRGVDTSHTALSGSDTFPLADEFEEGTVYLLAERLSPDYMRPRTFDADDWFRAIQAAYMTVEEVTLPTAISRMPSQYWPEPSLRGGSSS